MQIPLVPFTILALAPTGPHADHPFTLEIVPTDLFSLDEAIEALGPRFRVSLPARLCPEGQLTLHIRSMKGFKPDSLVQEAPYLKSLYEAGRLIDEGVASGRPAEQIAERLKSQWPDLPLDLSISQGKPQSRVQSPVDDILAMVAIPQGPGGETHSSSESSPRSWRAQVDRLLASLLEHIFANGEFRTYEAAWRGIEVLLKQGQVKEGGGIEVKIVPVGMDSLEEALDMLMAVLPSDIPNLVLIDLPFDTTPRCIDLLEKVAAFAESMLVPTVGWITPRFFNLERWEDLGKLPYIGHHLEDAAFAKWRKLREHSASSWMAVTCNRFLSRYPYGEGNSPRKVSFQEKERLWISPVWALGALVAQSVSKYGWPSRFTDYSNVRLEQLALHELPGERPISTEMSLSENRLMELIEAGLTPLFGMLNKDIAFIPKATMVAGDSLAYQLFITRFLGFLFWCREHLGNAESGMDIARDVKNAISLFFQKSSGEPPVDLTVVAGQTDEDGSIPLHISLTPPRSILGGEQKLELTFDW